MSRGSRLIAIGLLCSFVLAACGGSNDDSNGGGGGTSSAAVTESPSVDTSSDTSSGSGGMVDLAACEAVGVAFASATAAAGAAMTGNTSQLQDALDQFESYMDQVPDEIKDDLNTVAQGYQQFMQAIVDSGYDSTSGQAPTAEQLAAITAASDALDTGEFKTASDNVSAWVDANCG